MEVDKTDLVEKWKGIRNCKRYEISNFGRIRNVSTGYVLRHALNAGKYPVVRIKYNDKLRNASIHRLVAGAFIPNTEELPCVNHKNHIRHDNVYLNLEWVSYRDNNLHKRQPEPLDEYRQATRPIWKCDPKTGERLEKFDTIKLAAESIETNATVSGIQSRLVSSARGRVEQDGRSYEVVYGFSWEYQEHEDIEGEIWKDVDPNLVKGGEGYQVSDMGRIKNRRGRVTVPYDGGAEYLFFTLYPYQHPAHVVLAKTFIPNPEMLPMVNHMDGDKQNISLDNLEWISASGNTQHAHDIGLFPNDRLIHQLDLDGNFIAEHTSMANAARKSDLPATTIRYGIYNKRPAGGFLWKDADDDDFQIAEYTRECNIHQYSDDVLVAEFRGITEASTATNISAARISNALKDKDDNTWKYAYESKEDSSRVYREVNMYTEDGEQLLGVYSSVHEASDDTGIAVYNIRASTRTHRPTNGFMWCYSDQELFIAALVPEEDQKRGRAVIQMTLEGEFIAEFRNMEEAYRQTGIKACNICYAIAQDRATHGFTWKYVTPRANRVKTPERLTGRPVDQLSLEGKLVKQYRSVAEAGRQTGIKSATLQGAIERRRPCKDFYWKFQDDEFKPEPNKKIRAVYQMDMQKKKLAYFDSMGDAHRATGIKPNAIYASILYDKPRSGFLWAYANVKYVSVKFIVDESDGVLLSLSY